MDRGPDDRSGSDPTAAEFDAIVAGLRRDGAVPAWPDDGAAPGQPPRTPPMPAPPVPPEPASHRPAPEPDPASDHFVPPEPPPLPRIGPPAMVGVTLLVLGLVLVTAPSLVGVPDVYGLPLGLVSLAAGLGWLVLRLWPTPPDGRDDDGAQV